MYRLPVDGAGAVPVAAASPAGAWVGTFATAAGAVPVAAASPAGTMPPFTSDGAGAAPAAVAAPAGAVVTGAPLCASNAMAP